MSKTGDAERLSALGTDVISLYALIGASRRLDELSTARVIGEAAEAVHKAQKGGQALGTLSPAAIVVSASGGVGLEPGAAGAVGYSAPERLRGSPGDRRSDVFSLGVLLWEALAHERLFEGATDDAVKAAVLGGELRPPSSCNANVPAELDAICKKALARDPADRYQSAKVMAAEISAVLDDAGYPESNDELARYVAAELASGPEPAATIPEPTPASVSAGWTASDLSRSTTLGIAPIHEPASSTRPTVEEPVLLEKKVEPAPVLLERRKDKPSEQLAPVKPAEAAKPGGAAKPAEFKVPEIRPKTPTPAPEPRAKTPSSSPDSRAKTPSASPEPRAESPTPSPSSLPAWATARSSPSQPPPMTTLPGQADGPKAPLPSVLPQSSAPQPVPVPAPPSVPPAAEAAPHTTTTVGVASNAPAPLVLGPIPGGTVEPSAPSMLGVLKPGNQTAILGSIGAAAEPPPPAPPIVPAVPEPPTTARPGSGTRTDEAKRLASVQWHDGPPIEVPKPTPAISEAETVGTPALVGVPPGATTGDAIPKPIEHHASQAGAAGAIPAAGALPPSADDFDEPKETPHPASVVALRTQARGDQSKGDMLGTWGWGTDSHEAFDDDAYHDSGRASRKRLFLAIGGAAGAILLVTVIAVAAGGGSKKAADPPAPVAQAAAAWEVPTAPPAPPPTPPAPATDPAPAAGSAAPAAAAAADPPKPEPAAEPAKPEPAKPEPPKPAVAKVEPKKPEPPKIAAVVQPPPKKPEPPKVAAVVQPPPKKPEPPKVAAVAKASPKKPEPPKTDAAKPIDPYAADPKKIDPNTAYKTGFQQFVRGDSTGALATFKASLAANPGYAPTWRGIGLVYEKIGRSAQARTAFQRYLEFAPGAGDAGQIRERLDKLP